MNGILVIDKPKGMTSQQVVGRVKKILGVKKVGHTGTLDPDVDGVLPLCIGQATRLAEYLLDQSKAYAAELTLGYSTDTQDASGEIVERVAHVSVTEAEIRAAFDKFCGEIEQVPPAFSALKINGRRAYDLARQGERVALPPRRVTIYELAITELELDCELPRVRFRVECSKGTYVRTLCHDIGQTLGIPAHMSRLTRTRSGPFTLQMAHSLDVIGQAAAEGRIADYLLPPSVAVADFPCYVVTDRQARRVFNGLEMSFSAAGQERETGERIRLESASGQLLAIYRVVDSDGQTIRTKPEKVFNA
ncbi:tRNA pseudouridine(55) synthase TruB [Effusibacillus pohliae]|uniref:tRNA pseudouridine(55) synthase TruB n=1 Tax=Effusibacillus pohliae TaxID=232270 RepID=UPI00036C327D|nr:tRNA pseudouridine(55) synthase TruB [Effusibacillus pohliae]